MTATHHDTIVIHRTFDASVDRVYAAWHDSKALERWCLPGDENWTSKLNENDFRVGGWKRIEFGPRGETPYVEESIYRDIVPGTRIVWAETISNGDVRISTSQITIQLASNNGRTDLTVTDQIALLDGQDTAEARRGGWGEVLDRLVEELANVAV